MSRLQDTLRDKNNTVEHRKEFSDFHKIKKKKELNKKIIKYTAICGCIAVVLGAIYVPQYFIKNFTDSVRKLLFYRKPDMFRSIHIRSITEMIRQKYNQTG